MALDSEQEKELDDQLERGAEILTSALEEQCKKLSISMAKNSDHDIDNKDVSTAFYIGIFEVARVLSLMHTKIPKGEEAVIGLFAFKFMGFAEKKLLDLGFNINNSDSKTND